MRFRYAFMLATLMATPALASGDLSPPDPTSVQLPDLSSTDPEVAYVAASMADEMRAIAPVFARGRPVPLPFKVKADGLVSRAWTYRGRDYLVLINRTKDRQWKVPSEALEPTWRPLFEMRREPRELVKEYRGSYYLKPHQVLVLESRLRPKRLLGR